MKKHQQLGMNPGTAAYRLRTDLLFAFAVAAGHRCHHCNEALTRETFSIEHKEPWLDSEDPVGKFFDLANIAYSHQRCNSAAARTPTKIYHTDEERQDAQRRYQRESNARSYTASGRHARYVRTGN